MGSALAGLGVAMNSAKKYWFPAKRYGWGWGLPSTRQGWLVLIAYIVSVGLLAGLALPGFHPIVFGAGTLGLSGVLVAICWLTGEPPRWRWGSDR
jgi:hypothetical protein